MDDSRYPSTDGEQSVMLEEFPYPDAKNGLNRWLPIVKWALAIPRFIVLFFHSFGAFFAIGDRLVRNSLQRAGATAHRLTASCTRRLALVEPRDRVRNVLVTDEYPPFRLGA